MTSGVDNRLRGRDRLEKEETTATDLQPKPVQQPVPDLSSPEWLLSSQSRDTASSQRGLSWSLGWIGSVEWER
jgi:hypothetical protein